jgi:hypothetical protein
MLSPRLLNLSRLQLRAQAQTSSCSSAATSPTYAVSFLWRSTKPRWRVLLSCTCFMTSHLHYLLRFFFF